MSSASATTTARCTLTARSAQHAADNWKQAYDILMTYKISVLNSDAMEIEMGWPAASATGHIVKFSLLDWKPEDLEAVKTLFEAAFGAERVTWADEGKGV